MPLTSKLAWSIDDGHMAPRSVVQDVLGDVLDAVPSLLDVGLGLLGLATGLEVILPVIFPVTSLTLPTTSSPACLILSPIPMTCSLLWCLSDCSTRTLRRSQANRRPRNS